jgi:hypothetical protein
MCAGRKGCRSIIFNSCPAGPSSGTFCHSAAWLARQANQYTTYRIWSWSQTVERVLAVLICHELAAKIQIALIEILLFIQPCESLSGRVRRQRVIFFTIGRRLPGVDSSSSDRLASGHICNPAVHESDLSILWRVETDSCAIRPYWVICSPERTQNCRSGQAFCAFRGSRKCNVVN